MKLGCVAPERQRQRDRAVMLLASERVSRVVLALEESVGQTEKDGVCEKRRCRCRCGHVMVVVTALRAGLL